MIHSAKLRTGDRRPGSCDIYEVLSRTASGPAVRGAGQGQVGPQAKANLVQNTRAAATTTRPSNSPPNPHQPGETRAGGWEYPGKNLRVSLRSLWWSAISHIMSWLIVRLRRTHAAPRKHSPGLLVAFKLLGWALSGLVGVAGPMGSLNEMG